MDDIEEEKSVTGSSAGSSSTLASLPPRVVPMESADSQLTIQSDSSSLLSSTFLSVDGTGAGAGEDGFEDYSADTPSPDPMTSPLQTIRLPADRNRRLNDTRMTEMSEFSIAPSPNTPDVDTTPTTTPTPDSNRRSITASPIAWMRSPKLMWKRKTLHKESSSSSSASSDSTGHSTRHSIRRGVRDSFFGRAEPDPLRASVHHQFNLPVIEEQSGGIQESFGQIITQQMGWGCRRWKPATFWAFVVGFTTIVSTVLVGVLSSAFGGYELDPGLVMGSFQTLVLCSIVIVTFHGMQQFQGHPNPLIYYKCIVDSMLAIRFLFDPLFLELGLYVKDEHQSCAFLSGVTQFLYLSSDSWYFMLIVDLYISLRNPFASVQHNRTLYKRFVYSFSFLMGLLVALVPSMHGLNDGNYCWTKRGTSKDRRFFDLNRSTWTVFYSWMIVFYVSGFAVLAFGLKRLRTGLKDTLGPRKEMLRKGALSIVSYTSYWTFVFVSYSLLFTSRGTVDEQGKMQSLPKLNSFLYILAGRGAVDFFVWFMVNDPSLMKQNWLVFSNDSADTKYSAQLNTALQRELISFTIQGMIRAVKDADDDLALERTAMSPTTVATDNSSVVLNHITVAHAQGEQGNDTSTPQSTVDSAADASSRQSIHSSQAGIGSNEMISDITGFRDSYTDENTTGEGEHFITFTPYAGKSFAELREAYGIRAEDFVESFRTSTKPSISEGASGAFMFFSGDKRFIVKSMEEAECRFLIEIADQYVEYLMQSRDSFITKFYGCFRISLYGNEFFFVVMENLFDVMEQGVTIHHRYDIKGSWVNRSYKRPRRGAKVKCRNCSMRFTYGQKKTTASRCPNVVGYHEPNVVLKDDDLHTKIRIGANEGMKLYEQLTEDSLFLCSLGIMDYSLLLGVVDVEFFVERKNSAEPQSSSNGGALSMERVSRETVFSRSSRSDPSFMNESLSSMVITKKDDPVPDTKKPDIMQRRFMRKSERVFGPGYYYIGIIDILQTWNFQKRMERFYKVHFRRCDPEGISAIDPVAYQKRFEKKLRDIISLPRDARMKKMQSSRLNAIRALGKFGKSRTKQQQQDEDQGQEASERISVPIVDLPESPSRNNPHTISRSTEESSDDRLLSPHHILMEIDPEAIRRSMSPSRRASAEARASPNPTPVRRLV